MNKMKTLSEAERAAGVVAASAGNHGQAVAWAAREAGIPATIFMPLDAPMSKVDATKNYGAHAELAGARFEDALAAASEYVETTGATFVHPFEDPVVIAGQGTIGLELAEQVPDMGTVLIPIGGGGLSTGIATTLRAVKPDVRLVGVQAGVDGIHEPPPHLDRGVLEHQQDGHRDQQSDQRIRQGKSKPHAQRADHHDQRERQAPALAVAGHLDGLLRGHFQLGLQLLPLDSHLPHVLRVLLLADPLLPLDRLERDLGVGRRHLLDVLERGDHRDVSEEQRTYRRRHAADRGLLPIRSARGNRHRQPRQCARPERLC